MVTFLLGLSMFVIGSGALAQAAHPDRAGPGKGHFDWTQFEGKYDLSECRSSPSAIWGGGPAGTFVQIEHKLAHARTPASQGLDLMRANNRNPIALGWSLERVGQGRRTDNDAGTGRAGTVTESYATVDGVYGMMAWNRPYNAGWSTLQLRMDVKGNKSFTLRQRTDSDATTREETCTLKKYVPKITT